MTQRVLLTGATGLLGSAVAELLSMNDCALVGVGRGPWPQVLPLSEYYQGDLADVHLLGHIPGPFDAIIHLAAHRGDADLHHYIRTNILGTAHILAAGLYWNVNRIVYASTAAVYGVEDADEEVDEARTVLPRTVYAKSKSIGEHVLSLDSRSIILRFSYLYGKGDRMSVLSRLLRSAVSEQAITVQRENRDFLSVRDAASAVLAALRYQGPERVFDVGSGSLTALDSIAARIGQLCSHGLRVQFQGTKGNAVLLSRRARQELGWEPSSAVIEELPYLLSLESPR